MKRIVPLLLAATLLFFATALGAQSLPPARQKLVDALIAPAGQQPAAVRALIGEEDPKILRVLTDWREGEVFIHTTADGKKIPFTLSNRPDGRGGFAALAVADDKPIIGSDGQPLSLRASELQAVDTNNAIRRAIRDVSELAGVNDPNPDTRASAAERLGQSQKPEHLPLLKARLAKENVTAVKKALETAIGFIGLSSTDRDQQLQAVDALVKNHSLAGVAQFKQIVEKAEKNPGSVDPAVASAAKRGSDTIEAYFQVVNFFGTMFRGVSLSSVLLVMALGLAITFGLMGVINMAHGEIMVVGAYATYLVQNLFISWFGKSGTAFSWYFVAALPVAFVSAALVGLVIERGIIRFLYSRPLESLLATWGVSLILQQTFRLIFGPANVQILSPGFLMGNFTFHDIIFAYNRVFVIGFAALIVTGVWLLLTKTNLGLTIRTVTQNRTMASCMGIRTDRVNMLTFALGSGLAGLAGACLTQLGNVGPSLGQTHIVDNFMVVVSGGVGNLLGTIFAAVGIGTIDQILQPWFGAVMGKILVLTGIILLLQWKPKGLFPAKSRGLDN